MIRTSFHILTSPILVLMTGCVAPDLSGGESCFCPSHGGVYVASLRNAATDFRAGPDSYQLWRSDELLVRRTTGKCILKLPLIDDDLAPSSNILAREWQWSPSGRHLAIQGREMWVIDARQRTASRFQTDGVLSFRWRDDGRLVYCTHLGAAREINIGNGVVRDLLTETWCEAGSDDPPSYSNHLSPDGRYLVRCTGEAIEIIDLTTHSILYSSAVNGSPEACWWDSQSRRCLLALDGLSRLCLYDNRAGTLEVLTSRLRDLDDRCTGYPVVPRFDRVWAKSGRWFILGSHIRDTTANPAGTGLPSAIWICNADASSGVCLQDVIDANPIRPQVSPGHDLFAFEVANARTPGANGVYVCTVDVDASGRVVVGRPERLLDSGTTWFWSASGKSLITFTSGRFGTHDVGHLL